jgi:enoyl-CoA hydratase
MELETILYEKQEAVATITLNRPAKRNTVNLQMRDEMIRVLEDAGSDDQVRAVVITGGTGVFCAGADLKSPPTPPTLWDKMSPKRTYSYYHLIEDMGKPVIAAIAGYCLGGGLELACTCDIRIAAENALLGDAHSRIGVIGGGGSTQRIPRIIGIAKAKELIFSGEPIDAREAERIGLVNKVVPTEALLNVARSLAKLYSQRPPLVLKLVKHAIDTGMQMALAQGLDFEAKCAALLGFTEDYQEGVRAFMEKRPPVFKGK